MLPLLQEAAAATAQTGAHPLNGTAAQWLWAVPLLPFLGFLINGALSLSPHAIDAAALAVPRGVESGGGGHESRAPWGIARAFIRLRMRMKKKPPVAWATGGS